MSLHALLQDLIDTENLTESQAAGALGLALGQLKQHYPDEFGKVLRLLPEANELIARAPEVKSGFLGGLAHSLGGEKGQILMILSKGLGQLGIPVDQQKSLARTLHASAEKHCPELVSLFNRV
ncbi:MAG: hypothetical protein ACO3N7_08320 [Kiritimatiellia bacterium]